MSPLWWEILFLAFIMSYILMNIIIYFMPQIKQINKNKNINMIDQSNWKW
nr:ATP synthase F0 subunit 8 [Eysarcoris rosaceus]